ncbi:MAG: hypothetical protein ABSB74_01645 [Tepidisphaeraceae bacterium]
MSMPAATETRIWRENTFGRPLGLVGSMVEPNIMDKNYLALFADLQRNFDARRIEFLQDREIQEVLRKQIRVSIDLGNTPSESSEEPPWQREEEEWARPTAIAAGRLTARAVQNGALREPEILIVEEKNLPLDLADDSALSFWIRTIVPAMEQLDSSGFPYRPASPGDLLLSSAAACSVLSKLAAAHPSLSDAEKQRRLKEISQNEHPTTWAAAKYVVEHPGAKGFTIDDATGNARGHFRNHIFPILKTYGFTGSKKTGYNPPK